MADNRIPAGDPVTHSPTGTLVGTDGQSTRNFNNVANAGEHDVVAHGSPNGWLEMPHGNVNAGQLVDAVTTIRTTTVDRSGSWCVTRARTDPGSPTASPTNSAPPCAPTDRVGTDRLEGTGQTPVIDKGGYWRGSAHAGRMT